MIDVRENAVSKERIAYLTVLNWQIKQIYISYLT